MTLKKILTGNPGNLEELAEMALERSLPVYVNLEEDCTWKRYLLGGGKVRMTAKVTYSIELENGEKFAIESHHVQPKETNLDTFRRDYNKRRDLNVKNLNKKKIRCIVKRIDYRYNDDLFEDERSYEVTRDPITSNEGALSLLKKEEKGNLSFTQEGGLAIKND